MSEPTPLQDLRREELEQKVQAKVKEEHEKFVEEQRRKLQEEKDAELALREKIKKEQEEKESRLLVKSVLISYWSMKNIKWELHRSQLGKWLKTETKPHIYYRPTKLDESLKQIIEERSKQLQGKTGGNSGEEVSQKSAEGEKLNSDDDHSDEEKDGESKMETQ